MNQPHRHYARETFETVEDNCIYSGVNRTAWQVEARDRMEMRSILQPHRWGGAHFRARWRTAILRNGFAIPSLPNEKHDFYPVSTEQGAKLQAVRMLLILALDPTHPTAPSAFDEAFHFAREDQPPRGLMKEIALMARNRSKVKGGIGRKEFDNAARSALARTATGRYYVGPPTRKTRTPK